MRFNPQVRNANVLPIRQCVIFVASFVANEQRMFVVAIKKIIAQFQVHERIFCLVFVTRAAFCLEKYKQSFSFTQVFPLQ